MLTVARQSSSEFSDITTSLTDEQIHAIALGLENSGQKFVWVLRDADKGDIFSGDVRKYDLPTRYEDRISETRQGIIVRDWAPQLDILAHASTGGFMSHCGWNSCLESLTMGVPMVTWPMHSDQPRNALLITKALKLGIDVKEWTQENDLVESFHIENAVKKLIASKEGDEMRNRAAELRNDIKKSVAEGLGIGFIYRPHYKFIIVAILNSLFSVFIAVSYNISMVCVIYEFRS